MMYLIPKNIKARKEILKGFAILEIIVMALSLGLGLLLQKLYLDFHIKVILFFCITIVNIFNVITIT